MKKSNKIKDSFSPFIFGELRKQASISNESGAVLSNWLNLSVRDLEKIENGEKELSVKEIDILCKETKVEIDKLYTKFEEFNKKKSLS